MATDLSGKPVIPFCTHMGSGLGQRVEDLVGLCGASKIEKGLAIWGSTVDRSQEEVSSWLKEIEG